MLHKTHRIVSLNLFLVIMIILYNLHRFNNIVETCIYTVLTAKLTWHFSTLPDFLEWNERKNHRTWAHSLFNFILILFVIFIIKYLITNLLLHQSSTTISYIEIVYTIHFIPHRLGKPSSTRFFFR